MESELVIGVISAASALGGVVVSQFFSLLQSHFERKHQKNLLLRAKYEELVQQLNEAVVWGKDLTFCKSTAELQARTVPLPARRVYSLCLLYFQKLKEPAAQLIQASIALHDVLVKNFTESEPGTAGGQTARKSLKEFSDATLAMQEARLALDAAIEKHAGLYIAA